MTAFKNGGCPAAIRLLVYHISKEELLIVQFVVAVSCALVISALCSIIEAVLYSTPASHIEVLAQQGRKSGRILKKLKSDIHKPITAILTLNTVANTMGAAIAGSAAAALFGQHYLVLFSICFTLAILIFSEILPKTAGVAYSRELAPFIALPLNWLVTIFTPLILFFKAVTQIIPKMPRNALVSAEEVLAIAALSRKAGEIDPQQEKIITNIVGLKEKNVRSAMTPRTVTYILSEHLGINEAIAKQKDWDRHSRIPVYDQDSDDIVGIVFSKDILSLASSGQLDAQLANIIKPVHFAPENASLYRVLMDFFERHQHLFVVVDEYGSFTGVISLEDIIEEIVGREILDESDKTVDMRELARRKRRMLTGEGLSSGRPSS